MVNDDMRFQAARRSLRGAFPLAAMAGSAADFGDVLARLEAAENCRRIGASNPPAPFSGTAATPHPERGSAAA